MDADGYVYLFDGGFLKLDFGTGTKTRFLGSEQLDGFGVNGAVIQDTRIIAMVDSGVRSYDLERAQELWLWQWGPGSVVDLAAVTSEFVAVPTPERAVSVIDIP